MNLGAEHSAENGQAGKRRNKMPDVSHVPRVGSWRSQESERCRVAQPENAPLSRCPQARVLSPATINQVRRCYGDRPWKDAKEIEVVQALHQSSWIPREPRHPWRDI